MKPLQLGAHSIGFIWEQDAVETVGTLAALGFRRVEFCASARHLDIWAPIRETTAILKKALHACGSVAIGLDIAAHDYNLASLDDEVVSMSLSAYERLMDIASELEIPAITVHGGRRMAFHPPPADLPWLALRRSFDRLALWAQRRSQSLLVENIAPAFLNTAESMLRFTNEGGWDNVDFIFDVANAVGIGENAVEALQAVLKRTKIIHLSDCDPGRAEHAPIGSRSIDFGAIANVLTEMDYSGEVVIEICSAAPAQDTLAAKAALENAGWAFA